MKLVSESLASMSILPDKNLVVTFIWSRFLTAKDLIDPESQGQSSRIIFVFRESAASAIFESIF